MKGFLQKVKLSLAHKHTWQEDQWGKRCQECGRVRTNKTQAIDAKLTKAVKWLFDVVYFALAISVVILVAWKGIDEESIRHALIVLDTNTYWVFLYIFVLLTMMTLKHIAFKETET